MKQEKVPVFLDHIEEGLTPLSPLEAIEWELEKLELEEIALWEEHYYREQEMRYRDMLLKAGIEPGDYIH
jgi:hypothetical protein